MAETTHHITRTLADFVATTRFEDLPSEVVDYTKLVILDSLICGIAAGGMERSRMMHGVVEALQGPEEASVFGLRHKVPAMHAAMANAEIMNLLDADDTFFTSTHFAVFNVAGALAEAQRLRSNGKRLILATAVGFDVNARINLAQFLMDERDGEFVWSRIMGSGFAAMGTAASAAVVGELSTDDVHRLFGLTSWLAPTPVVNKMTVIREMPSFKYSPYSGIAQSGMLALALTRQGYHGDAGCLDGELNFCDAQGSMRTDTELLVGELGSKWWILETALKYQPSCRYTHGPITMLQRLMTEEKLEAGDIEKIEVRMNPMGYALNFFKEPAKSLAADHCAPLNGSFNIPYVLALIALGRTPSPLWYSEQNLSDPEVWDLASRIVTAEDTSARDEVRRAFKETRIRRFRKTPSSMTVWARGREFVRESDYADGDPWTPETRPTWDRIRRKFQDFCGHMLPATAIDELTKKVRQLETLDDVDAELVLPVGA